MVGNVHRRQSHRRSAATRQLSSMPKMSALFSAPIGSAQRQAASPARPKREDRLAVGKEADSERARTGKPMIVLRVSETEWTRLRVFRVGSLPSLSLSLSRHSWRIRSKIVEAQGKRISLQKRVERGSSTRRIGIYSYLSPILDLKYGMLSNPAR